MPNRTIYVADADLPIFEKAQELAGENLSATIAECPPYLLTIYAILGSCQCSSEDRAPAS
jgi:hypothetical protein